VAPSWTDAIAPSAYSGAGTRPRDGFMSSGYCADTIGIPTDAAAASELPRCVRKRIITMGLECMDIGT
jgi:hypothetical protein